MTCSIIGIRNISCAPKTIFDAGVSHSVKNINSYLAVGNNVIVSRRSTPIYDFPKMDLGNMPIDGGNLILSTDEKIRLVSEHPEAERFIRKLYGSKEYINGLLRWCLWIEDGDRLAAESVYNIKKKFEAVRKMRLSSKDSGTQKLATRPHQFREMKSAKKELLIISRVSSERRAYIPMGILEKDCVIADAQVIYDPECYLFGVLSSRIHMTWVRAVAGRLKTDYRYSSALCYNTFPFPDISKKQKTTLEDLVFKVLDEREHHPENTMAQLYDPDKMPDGLRQAHHEMDLAVEQCYRPRPFKSDEERLEYLFKRYEEMIEAEKQK